MAVGRMREEKRSILICSDLQPYQVYTFHCWQLGLIIALNTPSGVSQSENSIINHNQSPPPTLYPPLEDTNNVCSHPPDGLIRQLPISSLSSGLAKDPLTLIVKWSLCDDCQRVRDAQDAENNGGDKWSTGTQWCMQRGVWWSIRASEECITVSPSLSEMEIIVVPPTSPIILITPDSDPVLAQHIVIIFPKEFNPPWLCVRVIMLRLSEV